MAVATVAGGQGVVAAGRPAAPPLSPPPAAADAPPAGRALVRRRRLRGGDGDGEAQPALRPLRLVLDGRLPLVLGAWLPLAWLPSRFGRGAQVADESLPLEPDDHTLSGSLLLVVEPLVVSPSRSLALRRSLSRCVLLLLVPIWGALSLFLLGFVPRPRSFPLWLSGTPSDGDPPDESDAEPSPSDTPLFGDGSRR